MSSVFDRFPSVQDLLSRPAIRRLTQTLDRGVVVERVKQYMGNIRTQFDQATAAGKLPSLAGLAERIARWIAENEQLGPRQVINATGDLFHTEYVQPPLAEAACSAMASSALSGVFDSDRTSETLAFAERRLAALVGAEAVCVCNNLSAAMSLLFAGTLTDRRVLVRRGDVIEFNDGMRLSDLASDHRTDLVEVGASNRVRLDDFKTELQTPAVAWLRLTAEAHGEAGEPIEIGKVRDLATKEFFVAEYLAQASVQDWSGHGLGAIPVVGDRLAAGVDLVVFPGDRWLGGPSVGILAGKQSLIDALQQSSYRFAAAVDPIRAAGFEAAVRQYDDPESAAEKHPILSLMLTATENLKNRAERIAPQVAALDGVATAEVIEPESLPLPNGEPRATTFGVRVFPKSISVAEAREQLASHPQFSVLSVESDEFLMFDLRSVHPRYDAELIARVAEVLRGEEESEQAAESE